jgi:hypothetical protein
MPEDAKHSDPKFASHGTYVARLMDAFDILSSATASLEPNVSDRAGKLPARRDSRYSVFERTFALAAFMIPQYPRSGVSCLSAPWNGWERYELQTFQSIVADLYCYDIRSAKKLQTNN